MADEAQPPEAQPPEVAEHLQRAAGELIGAARSFLDLAEDLIAHPGPLAAVATAVVEALGPLAARGRAALNNREPDVRAEPPEPRVTRIEVS